MDPRHKSAAKKQITEARVIEKHVKPQQKTPSPRADTEVRDNQSQKNNQTFASDTRETNNGSVPKRSEAM